MVEVNQEAVAGAHSHRYYRPKNNLPKNQHLPHVGGWVNKTRRYVDLFTTLICMSTIRVEPEAVLW